jgi:16S rRNA (adenine1518-N6/adenine1519-N6)-dimethyltransferase
MKNFLKIGAKKSLGQNFLKSSAILNEIVEAGEISEDDFVIEIGPGKGALTEKILETGATVLAIEKDSRLIEFLNEKFVNKISAGKLKIVEKDILEFDVEDLNGVWSEFSIDKKYKLIANIPYYITGQIFEKFLSAENQPKLAVFMIQKEVCDRIIARDNKESILSISVKAYCEPKYIQKVPARYFSPAPKVDSAIIKLQNISKEKFIAANVSEKDFFELVKAGFSHKRKVLISNLKEWAKNHNINLEEKFIQNNLDLKIRAENLSVQDWFNLLK